MDLQDEHDRHSMHMYGLNDTCFTINDFFDDLNKDKKAVHKKEDKKKT